MLWIAVASAVVLSGRSQDAPLPKHSTVAIDCKLVNLVDVTEDENARPMPDLEASDDDLVRAYSLQWRCDVPDLHAPVAAAKFYVGAPTLPEAVICASIVRLITCSVGIPLRSTDCDGVRGRAMA